MSPRPRLMLDTEALLRAWRNDGPARELVQRAAVRDFSLCTSTTILDELDEVLARPRFAASAEERQVFRRTVLMASDHLAMFDEADSARRSPDPGDDHVIEAALRTGADVVVSQNTTDLAFAGYEVLTAAEACQWLRDSGPFGISDRLGPQDLERQAAELTELGGDPYNIRRGADVVLRGLTDSLQFTRLDDDSRFSPLPPEPAAALIARAVRMAGRGLLLDIADGGSFDYVSGTWRDVPGREGAIPFDLLWYSSDRAQGEAIAQPGSPTIADWGWSDEHRHRTLLAGAIVVVVESRGPSGEDDVRFIALIGEPAPVTPPIDNPYRRASTDDGVLTVRYVDPTGLMGSLTMALAGGPSAILFPGYAPPSLVDAAFDVARNLCGRMGWPAG